MVFKKGREKNRALNIPAYRRESSYSISRLVSAAGIIVICGLLVIIGAQYIRQLQVEKELGEYEARMEQYEQRLEAAEKEIDRLQDLNYIEIQARSRLGLVKPDEIIFQFED